MNKPFAYGSIFVAATVAMAAARTWTSADGRRTFEGDYKSYDADNQTVTVVRGYQKTSFALDVLSVQDQEWVKAEAARVEEAKRIANAPDVEELLEEQVVGKHLTSGILEKFDGKKFSKAELDMAPEYYLLYFSASW